MSTYYFKDLIGLIQYYNGHVHGALNYFYLYKNGINESNLIFKGSTTELLDAIDPKNSELYYYAGMGTIKEWFIDGNIVVVILVR